MQLCLRFAAALHQGSRLREDIARLRESVLAPLGWGQFKEQWILDTCKVAVDLPFGFRDPEELVSELQTHPELLEQSVSRLGAVATFLAEHCQIMTPRLLPYEQFATILAEFFRLCPEPSEEQLVRLRQWFWHMGYQMISTSATFSALAQAVTSVRKLAMGESLPLAFLAAPERPKSVTTSRSARARSLGLLLARQTPLRSDGETKLDVSSFAEGQWLFVLFTRGSDSSPGGWQNQIGNRIIADARDLSALRRKLADPSAKLLRQSHAFPPEAIELLSVGKQQEFVHHRTDYILKLEREFLVDEHVIDRAANELYELKAPRLSES